MLFETFNSLALHKLLNSLTNRNVSAHTVIIFLQMQDALFMTTCNSWDLFWEFLCPAEDSETSTIKSVQGKKRIRSFKYAPLHILKNIRVHHCSVILLVKILWTHWGSFVSWLVSSSSWVCRGRTTPSLVSSYSFVSSSSSFYPLLSFMLFSFSQSDTGTHWNNHFMEEAVVLSALFEQQEVDGFHHVELFVVQNFPSHFQRKETECCQWLLCIKK